MGADDTKRFTRRYTENAEANQLYLKGRFYWNKRTTEALTKSIDYFRLAIEKDPEYALAFAGLADSYLALGIRDFGGGMTPKEAMPLAKEAARSALRRDPDLAEAHASLGTVAHFYDWDWALAEKELKKAIDLDPSYAEAHRSYGLYLRNMGRFDEARREYKQALDLDPLSPIINAHQGMILWYSRQFDQAIEPLRKTIDLFPDYFLTYWYLGIVYEHKSMYAQAINQVQKAIDLDRNNPVLWAALARIHAKSGKTSEARKLLDELMKMSGEAYVSNYDTSRIYAALGDKNRALELLEKAYEDRDSGLSQIKLNPLLDNLRSEPRFAELVWKMNFPE